MKRLILTIAFLTTLVFTGCTASGPVGFKPLPDSPGLGRLYIFRQVKFAGSGVNEDIFVDGKLVGTLPNGSYIVVYAPKGIHKIEAKFSIINKPWYKDSVIEVLSQENKDTYTEFDVTMTDMNITPYGTSTSWSTGFRNVPEQTAKPIVETLRINNANFQVLTQDTIK